MKLVPLSIIAALSLAAAQPALAQSNPASDRRFDRIERDLKTLQSIVLQAQATGQPVVVKPEGPDPAIADMRARVEDLQATLQRVNGGIETLTFELDQLKRNTAQDNTAQAVAIRDLSDRLQRLEALAAGAAPAAGLPGDPLAQAPALPPPPAPPFTGRDRDRAATARAQAEDQGVLGGPPPANPFAPPAAPPTPQTAADAFTNARALYNTGDFASAGDAFGDFIARYPSNPRAAEAYYWLGESQYARKTYREAIPSYAAALKDQPKTAWAPAAMVRLAQSLSQTNQPAQACAALAEYSRLYAARATTPVKTDAAAVRTRAKCG